MVPTVVDVLLVVRKSIPTVTGPAAVATFGVALPRLSQMKAAANNAIIRTPIRTKLVTTASLSPWRRRYQSTG